MGRLYLDIEYNNGNYYLADNIEIALIAGKWKQMHGLYEFTC